MNYLSSLIFLVSSVTANASTFNCKVIEDNNSGFKNAKITFQSNQTSGVVSINFTYSNDKTIQFVAKRSSNSYISNVVRFVDSKTNIMQSDSGTTEVLVSQSLLNGQSGTVTINGDQANEGETGPRYLPYLGAVLECK